MRNRLNQRGSMDPLMIPLIIAVLLLIGLSVFGVWAYTNYLDQKDNTDKIVAVAVTEAEQIKTEELEIEFAERAKSPHKTYVSPSDVGSVSITYPKNWSAYISDLSSSKPLDGFFHPNYVPADAKNTAYAIRVEVSSTDYDRTMNKYQREVEQGSIKASAVKKSGVTGTRLQGEIERDVTGIMVVFPLRDKTLKVWTESLSFENDFNNIVLKKLKFSP